MKYIKARNIFEARYEDLKKEHGSLGSYAEWISDNCSDKERFEQIVNKYLKDYNPQIRVANSVEQLEPWDKMTLINELEKECLNVTESLQTDIIDNQFGGKGSFGSFIKVLTALGVKELTVDNKKCSKDYLIVYDCLNVNKEDLLRILNRFQSLSLAKKKLTEAQGEKYGLYYSVKFNNKLYIEYGVLIQDKKEKVGEFILNNKSLKSLLSMKNAPIKQFIDQFTSVDLGKLSLLAKIKMHLNTYSPGYFQSKSEPHITIKDYILQLDVYGLGEWSGPNLKEEELDKYKSEFNTWVLSNKWNDLVLTSVTASNFWFRFKIKLK